MFQLEVTLCTVYLAFTTLLSYSVGRHGDVLLIVVSLSHQIQLSLVVSESRSSCLIELDFASSLDHFRRVNSRPGSKFDPA